MMPSLPKLIALMLILWTVWKVFRMIERRKEVARGETDDSDSKSSEHTSTGAEKKSGSLDLEECSKCGSWVIPPCDYKDRNGRIKLLWEANSTYASACLLGVLRLGCVQRFKTSIILRVWGCLWQDTSRLRLDFQSILLSLQRYWASRVRSSFSLMTLRSARALSIPATTLRALGPDYHWRAAYVQPSRRPTDGRFGNNPNRLQHYYQFQTIIKTVTSKQPEVVSWQFESHRS